MEGGGGSPRDRPGQERGFWTAARGGREDGEGQRARHASREQGIREGPGGGSVRVEDRLGLPRAPGPDAPRGAPPHSRPGGLAGRPGGARAGPFARPGPGVSRSRSVCVPRRASGRLHPWDISLEMSENIPKTSLKRDISLEMSENIQDILDTCCHTPPRMAAYGRRGTVIGPIDCNTRSWPTAGPARTGRADSEPVGRVQPCPEGAAARAPGLEGARDQRGPGRRPTGRLETSLPRRPSPPVPRAPSAALRLLGRRGSSAGTSLRGGRPGPARPGSHPGSGPRLGCDRIPPQATRRAQRTPGRGPRRVRGTLRLCGVPP